MATHSMSSVNGAFLSEHNATVKQCKVSRGQESTIWQQKTLKNLRCPFVQSLLLEIWVVRSNPARVWEGSYIFYL
jgi:hypothetical protein